MDHKNIKDRIWAAHDLLTEETTTRTKFEKIRTLVKGINKNLDKILSTTSRSLDQLEKLHQQKVIELTVDNLPENTEQQKKKKKLLLLFIGHWNQLKSEVNRVRNELKADQSTTSSTIHPSPSKLARIFAKTKGPLGLITLIAAGVVILNAKAAHITLHNQGCDSIEPATDVSIALPGLKLPNQPIADGESAELVMPPMIITVDNTISNIYTLKVLGANLNFNLDTVAIDFVFDATSLRGRKTTIKLSNKKNHTLDIICRA